MKHKKCILFLISITLLLFSSCGYSMNSLPQGEKLASYSSPSEQYTVVIYLCNGGATVDYSIRGELIDHSTDIKKNIYWSYHESEAKVEWIDETTVMINNKRLNIETDIYDWRQE